MHMSSDRFVTLAGTLDILKEAGLKRELGADQKIALDHADKTAKLPIAKARKLQEELSSLEFVSDAMACKITDILPTHPDDIRALFAKERLILEKSHIEKILEKVGHYL